MQNEHPLPLTKRAQHINDNTTLLSRQQIPNYRFVGYYPSWLDPFTSDSTTSALANLPSYANVVVLSFIRPDTTYISGSMDLASTGLRFSSEALVVKNAIALLKQRNPATLVLVAVGGGRYSNLTWVKSSNIAAFIRDFDLDGVNIDHEPLNPKCIAKYGKVTCASDSPNIAIIRSLRHHLPRPHLVTLAGWNIGGYGGVDWVNALPQGTHTGMAVNVLREVGTLLDMVFIMGYDAKGNVYNPQQAYRSYRALFDGQLMLGVSVGKEAGSSEHLISISEVNNHADYIKLKGGGGMMLWSLSNPNTAGPTAQEISQAICVRFGMAQCSCPVMSTTQCTAP